MAKQVIKGMAMLMLIVVLSLVTAVVSANGQSSRRQVATIPFEFVAGDKELSAGSYDVSRMTLGGETVCIRGTENAQSAIRLSSPIIQLEPADKGKLVFHRYGNTYFLAEVWSAGSATGRRLVKSSAEKAMAKELAANQNKTEREYQRVEIALFKK